MEKSYIDVEFDKFLKKILYYASINNTEKSVDYLNRFLEEVSTQKPEVIEQVFINLDNILWKIKSKSVPKAETNKKMWDDPDFHFAQVELEEAEELRFEFSNNHLLFLLADHINYEPVMKIKFAQMIENLRNIRQRTNIKTERSKITWDDPQRHFVQVKVEEDQALLNEISDLVRMYNIANEVGYLEGTELVYNLLYKISPSFADIMVQKNKNSMHK